MRDQVPANGSGAVQKIFYIGDKITDAEELLNNLGDLLVNLIVADAKQGLLAQIKGIMPDMVIYDLASSFSSGVQLVIDVRSDPQTASLLICAIGYPYEAMYGHNFIVGTELHGPDIILSSGLLDPLDSALLRRALCTS